MSLFPLPMQIYTDVFYILRTGYIYIYIYTSYEAGKSTHFEVITNMHLTEVVTTSLWVYNAWLLLNLEQKSLIILHTLLAILFETHCIPNFSFLDYVEVKRTISGYLRLYLAILGYLGLPRAISRYLGLSQAILFQFHEVYTILKLFG